MLTVQEIQAMSFEKSVFGGYDMKSVDEFVENFTEDYAAIQKESAALKSKMKVLVDKIEEYRSVEDGMRKALISAQNIAQDTINNAKAEAESLMESVRRKAEADLADYKIKITAERKRLELARQESVDFISKITGFHQKQMEILVALSTSANLQEQEALSQHSGELDVNLPQDHALLEQTINLGDQLSSTDVSEPAPSYRMPEDIRKYMDAQVSHVETTASIQAEPPEKHQAPPATSSGMKIKVMQVTLNNDGEDHESTEAKAKFEFGDLKFGSEYSPDSDGK